MDEISDLDRLLTLAEDRLKQAVAALSPKHKGGEWEEYHKANEEVLRIERKLAAAKGDEYAEPCGFPVKWDTGAPMPHLMASDYRVLLAFLLSEPDRAWDGTYVKVRSPSASGPDPFVVVEFNRCISARLGTPNDEVFEGHPLNGKGLEPYAAQRVVNSRWLKELAKINSVHRLHRPDAWRDLQHFIFWFHDSTFECVAESYNVETYRVGMKEILALMIDRMIAR